MEAGAVSSGAARPGVRVRRPGLKASIALGLAALILVLLLICSPKLVAALLLVLVPIAVGVGLAMVGIARAWAPWPWIAGAAFALIPAAFMSFVSFCHTGSGTCPSGSTMSHYHSAAIALGLALAGFALLIFTRRTRARDVAFAVISIAAQAWMIVRLLDAGLGFAVLLICVLLAFGVLETVRTALRERRRRAEAQALSA